MGSLVSYAVADGVATVTMDDGKVNALSPAMLAELGAALDRAEADGAAVVLAGRPGVFSAGYDLKVLRGGGDEAAAMLRSGFELGARMLAFPAPLVVACTGHAVAMGSFLLLCADVRIGAEGDFRIVANEVAIGLALPGAAIEICRQRLAPAVLGRALGLAETFSPTTAVAAGFLDRTVAAAQLAAEAQAAAAAVAALDRQAHATTKLRVRGPALDAIRAEIEAGNYI